MKMFRNILLYILFSSFMLAQCDSYILGDANSDNALDINGDFIVNILDVVSLIDYIFAN